MLLRPVARCGGMGTYASLQSTMIYEESQWNRDSDSRFFFFT